MSRHPFDPVSLVSGLVFAAVAAVYLLDTQARVDVDSRWVLPLALIGLGVGGILGAVNNASRQRRSLNELSEPDAGEPDEQSVSTEASPTH